MLGGKFSSIGVSLAGAAATIAYALNDVGQIAGEYFDTAGHVHGFVGTHGQYQSVDMPGATATFVTNINNYGVAMGEYQDVAGRTHGFIATPR